MSCCKKTQGCEHEVPKGLTEDGVMIFAIKFRFTLDNEHFPREYTHSVDLDLTNKKLVLKAYEVVVNKDGEKVVPIIEWAEKCETGQTDLPLYLTTWDACGNKLYEYKFYNIKIESRKSSYDMGSEEPCMQEIRMSYSRYERTKIRFTEEELENTKKTQKERCSLINDKKAVQI